MNKQIKELYSKAVLYAFDQRFKPLPEGPTSLQEVINGKFAELVIKECAKIANQAENNDSEFRCMYDVVIEHFGIKD